MSALSNPFGSPASQVQGPKETTPWFGKLRLEIGAQFDPLFFTHREWADLQDQTSTRKLHFIAEHSQARDRQSLQLNEALSRVRGLNQLRG